MPVKLHGSAKRINGGLQFRLSELARFGQSRHEAKLATREAYQQAHGDLKGFNPSKVDGVYSIQTMESYRKTAMEFSRWAADQGIKNAKQVTPEVCSQYLRSRQESGCSAYTVSKDMSALNKTLGYDLSKNSVGLASRSISEITRSRLETDNDKRDFSRYSEPMAVSAATGIRRESVTVIKPSDCIRNPEGQVCGIRVTEKGGKTRVAPVLNEHKDAVTEIVNKFTDENKPMFSRYDSHIDNHSMRAGYAVSMLRQLEAEVVAGKPMFGGDLDPHQYIRPSAADQRIMDNNNGLYRGYNGQAVAATSGCLGHNRCNIIFNHYAYK